MLRINQFTFVNTLKHDVSTYTNKRVLLLNNVFLPHSPIKFNKVLTVAIISCSKQFNSIKIGQYNFSSR